MQDVTHDMPLNETDKAWVRETIRDAHKRSRLGKFTSFLKEWSGVGAAMAFLLLVFTQWNTYIEFRTRTDDRLKSIEDDLRILKKFSANGAASSLADAGKYAKEGKIELAVKAAQQAAETITSAASGKVPASPG